MPKRRRPQAVVKRARDSVEYGVAHLHTLQAQKRAHPPMVTNLHVEQDREPAHGCTPSSASSMALSPPSVVDREAEETDDFRLEPLEGASRHTRGHHAD